MKRSVCFFVAVSVCCAAGVAEASQACVVPCGGAAVGSVFAFPTNGFSAAVWARPEIRIRSERETQNLVMAGDGWFSGFALRVRGRPDGAARAYFEVACEGRDRVSACAESVPLTPGRPVHLACTWNGGLMRLYVNGALATTKPFDKRYLHARDGASCVRFVSGTSSGSGGSACGGMVWQRVLSSEEIASLASGAPPLKETVFFAELFDRAFIRRNVGAKELLAAAEKDGVSRSARNRVSEVLPVAYLNDGDLESARRSFASLPAVFKTPDLEIAFADKMAEKGFASAAREIYAKHVKDAEGTPWVAVASDAYAAVCGSGAAVAASAPVSCTGASCPAVPQEGARVSAGMPEKRIFIAPSGDDRSGDGSMEKPFASARRARDEVRAMKGEAGSLPDGGVAVVFRAGVYRVSETLDLDRRDSGRPDAPVVWMSEEGARVVLSGGCEVPRLRRPDPGDPVMKRVPAEVRDSVRVADVGAMPFVSEPLPDYGYGFKCDRPITDLYVGSRLLTPARHPNVGWFAVTNLLGKTTTDSRGRVSTTGAFQANVDDIAAWAKEGDLRATGYWFVYWSDATRRMRVDPVSHSFSLERKTAVQKGGVFFLSQAARALDAAGEWYVDRESRRLYVIEPADGGGRYELSSFPAPFLRMTGCRNVRVEGLVFEKGRGNGIELKGCEDCVFAGNVVRGFGGNGLVAENGSRLSLQENVFRDFGHAAVVCTGGDRLTLAHSGIRVRGNDISATECRSRTYAPGLQLEGCGIEVSNNRFHHIPSSAMRIEGNDHFVVSNLVEDVLYESDDQGAVDMYFDTSYAGTMFGWNVWRRCGIRSNGLPKFCGRAAIRFDGHVSSQTVFCNRFEECGSDNFGAVQINGGRFNTVDNNLFINCSPAVTIQPIPLAAWTNGILRLVEPRIYGGKDGKGVDIRKEPYKSRYPHISRLMSSDQMNLLARNVVIGPGPVVARVPAATECRFNRMSGDADLTGMPEGLALLPVPTADDVGPLDSVRFNRASKLDRSPSIGRLSE